MLLCFRYKLSFFFIISVVVVARLVTLPNKGMIWLALAFCSFSSSAFP